MGAVKLFFQKLPCCCRSPVRSGRRSRSPPPRSRRRSVSGSPISWRRGDDDDEEAEARLRRKLERKIREKEAAYQEVASRVVWCGGKFLCDATILTFCRDCELSNNGNGEKRGKRRSRMRGRRNSAKRWYGRQSACASFWLIMTTTDSTANITRGFGSIAMHRGFAEGSIQRFLVYFQRKRFGEAAA